MFHPNEPSVPEEAPTVASSVILPRTRLHKIAVASGAIGLGAVLCGGLGYAFGGDITICGLPIIRSSPGTISGAITSAIFGALFVLVPILYVSFPTFRELVDTLGRITGSPKIKRDYGAYIILK
jgi:hypothetical protein